MPTINITPAKGIVNLAAGNYSAIYAAPVGCISATVNARIVSHDLAANIKIRMAIVPAGFVDGVIPPTDAEWIQPIDLILGPNGISTGMAEDTGIVLSPGETIVAYSDVGFANARVHGFVRTLGV